MVTGVGSGLLRSLGTVLCPLTCADFLRVVFVGRKQGPTGAFELTETEGLLPVRFPPLQNRSSGWRHTSAVVSLPQLPTEFVLECGSADDDAQLRD